MADALVAIGWNGPRTSAGAFGLGSNVSMCDGPPTRNNMMQLTSESFFGEPEALAPGVSAARRKPGSVSPRGTSAPACKKSRRVRPSQKRTPRRASSRIMAGLPKLTAGLAEGSTGECKPLVDTGQREGRPRQGRRRIRCIATPPGQPCNEWMFAEYCRFPNKSFDLVEMIA